MLHWGSAACIRLDVQTVEAVDKGDSSFLGNLGLDVLSERSGAEYTKVLSFLFAFLVGFNGGYE
jgi:hypothetical protein